MLGPCGSKLLVMGWCAFLGALTFLGWTDFALIKNAEWCGSADEHCLRDWIGALSGYLAAGAAAIAIFPLYQQLKMLQKDFRANHPPKLVFRQVDLDLARIAAGETRTDATSAFGGIYTFNSGATEATIEPQGAPGSTTFGNVVLIVAKHPPGSRPWDRARGANQLFLKSSRLKPGEGVRWDIVDASMVAAGDVAGVLTGTTPGKKLFVMGRVHFTDTLGVARHAAFCREWSPKEDRFIASDEPDYNYST